MRDSLAEFSEVQGKEGDEANQVIFPDPFQLEDILLISGQLGVVTRQLQPAAGETHSRSSQVQKSGNLCGFFPQSESSSEWSRLQRDVTATLWDSAEGFCFAKGEKTGSFSHE